MECNPAIQNKNLAKNDAGRRSSEASCSKLEKEKGEPTNVNQDGSCSKQNLSPVRNEQSLYNWQASKKTLKERLEFVLQKQLQTDVEFVVGKKDSAQTIPAHKFVLSIGSAVFDSMFNSLLATTEKKIEIPDVEPDAFSALLKFLYTDYAPITPDSVMTTLYAAKKYAVPALESNCVEFLKTNLSPQNAFMMLTQARLFDEPQLASLCLGCIDQNTKEALNGEGFTAIDIETLQKVLTRDTLGGLRECQLFQAVERWADAECERQKLTVNRENRRKVLGDTINLVRFPLMTIEEFANGPAQSGTLTDREIVDMFLYFTLSPKPAVKFSEMPRCAMTGKEYTVCRFNKVAERWGYSGTSDTIRFTVNHKLYIVGFGLFGATIADTQYQVDIELKSSDNQRVLAKSSSEFTCDGSMKTYRVLFRHPVEVLPDIPYIASATINGQESFYGTTGKRKLYKDVVARGVSKVQFSFEYVKGNNNGTSVEDGQIPEIIFYV